MSKADIEQGYTRLANQLIESMAQADLSGRQFRVLLVIIRKTYGFHKKTDHITASQIAETMNYSGATTHINGDIRTLEGRNIILKDGRKIGPNPATNDWKMEKESDRKRSEKVTENGQPGTSNLTKNGHNDTIKVTENSQKSDRKRSASEAEEKPEVTENGQGCDRKRSEKVTENGQHKRKKETYTKDNNPVCASGDALGEQDRFEEWWQHYPIKRNKKKSKDVWKRKKLNSIAERLISDVINRNSKDQNWLRGYIPLPTTYLNGERWDDELTRPTGDHQKQGGDRSCNSALEKVMSGIKATQQGVHGQPVDHDDPAVRPSVGEQLRRGSGLNGGMGSVIEGSFTRND